MEITKAWITDYGDYTHRVTLMDVVTIGARYYSQYDTNDLSEPILGRVVRSDVRPGARTTFFEIAEGNFEDHVFIRAGEIQKAQDALKEIFTRRIDQYVKIWDPYI